MLDGRITRFLRKCERKGDCGYDPVARRYVFSLYDDYPSGEAVVLFIYPKERRVWFLQIVEVFRGSQQGFWGEEDVYETVVRKSDDRKNLSSAEAASMIFAYISTYDYDNMVSKESLRLLM